MKSKMLVEFNQVKLLQEDGFFEVYNKVNTFWELLKNIA